MCHYALHLLLIDTLQYTSIRFDSSILSLIYSNVSCARHLGTNELDVDVQPGYVRVTVRGRVLQLVLNELVRGGRELRVQEATSQRSLTTGHLLVRIPFVRSAPSGCRIPLYTLYEY